MTFNPDEPRDQRGRWTIGGSHAIGSDIEHPNLASLKTALDRGVWKMTGTEMPRGKFSSASERTVAIRIEPNDIPSHWQSIERGNLDKDKIFFDPNLAHVEHDPEMEKIGRNNVVPNDIAQGSFPIDKGVPGILYRGMSYEEYKNAMQEGHFQSRGDYNLGDAQKGLTFYSTDPHQAEAYAHGFAPWQYIATPSRPAVVVAVKDPGGKHLINNTEIGVREPIPTSAIQNVWYGNPYIMRSGVQEVRQREGAAPQEGSGSSPRGSIAWSTEDKSNVSPGEKLVMPARDLGHGYSKDAKLIDGKVHTSNVYDATRALWEGRQVVLAQPDQVSTLIHHLGQVAKAMHELGGKAPTFNLCNVSVAGTNLFCAESKGIPRIKMPQLTDQQMKEFPEYLRSKGYKIADGDEKASHLRATQNELNGVKVAGIMDRLLAHPEDHGAARLIVSRDNYILDGHHRWAAEVGADAVNNKFGDERNMPISRVDIGITDLLKEADTYTGGAGHKGVEDVSRDKPKVEHDATPLSSGFGRQAGLTERPQADWMAVTGKNKDDEWKDFYYAAGHPSIELSDAHSHDIVAKVVAERAAKVAKELDYPVEKMKVTDNQHEFELNGTKREAAGTYSHNTDSVEMRAHTFYVHEGKLHGVEGVTAHEIMHAKYQALVNDYNAERVRVTNDPDYLQAGKWKTDDAGAPYFDRKAAFMRADGLLNEPYATKYPLYQKYTEAQMMGNGYVKDKEGHFSIDPDKGFAQTDGVTPYSRDYWKELAERGGYSDKAVHETLAEIARLQYQAKQQGKPTEYQHWRLGKDSEDKPVYFATGKDTNQLSPEWRNMYKLVQSNWKSRNKK